MVDVIIVEDESAISRGLTKLIRQTHAGFEVVCVCTNGKEGVDRILSLLPDLVFFDIHMPGLSGIEMMEQIRKKDNGALSDTTFIVLTGFADFSYAQKAISLGVHDYLLKPLSLDALECVLEKSFKKKTAELEKKRTSLIRNMLRDGIMEHEEEAALANERCSLFVVFAGPLCSNLFVGFSPPVSCDLPSQDHIDRIQKRFEVSVVSVDSHHPNEYLYVLYCSRECAEQGVFRAAAEELFLGFCVENSYVNAWLSGVVSNVRSLPDVLRELYLYASVSMRFDDSSLYDVQTINKDTVSVSREMIDFAAGFGSSMRDETLSGLVHTAICYWKKNCATQLQVVTDLRYLIGAAMRGNVEEDIFYPDASIIVIKATGYEKLEEMLLGLFRDICDIPETETQQSSPKLAARVREWLDMNYAQPIVYSDFRDRFGYSEKYIASLFKEKYGITPGKYLGKRRIHAAKTLMRENPRLLLKEIAELVGYADEFYFSRVFKNSEGISPGQFMQQTEK